VLAYISLGKITQQLSDIEMLILGHRAPPLFRVSGGWCDS
jgi:hypothetical protein